MGQTYAFGDGDLAARRRDLAARRRELVAAVFGEPTRDLLRRRRRPRPCTP